MNKRNTGILYALTLGFAVIFFVFYLFPGQKIEKHIMIVFARAFPDLELAIADLRPSLPLAVRLAGVKVIKQDNVLFETEVAKIGFPIRSVFSRAASFSFDARVYDGKADGMVHFMDNASRATADVFLSGIRIEKIPAVGQMNQAGISGGLNGSLTFDSAAASGRVLARLSIDDATVPLVVPFLNLDNISFKTITAETAFDQPDFSITQSTFEGSQVNGQMTGKITLNNPFEESMLDMEGTLEPSMELLKNFPVQLLPRRKAGQKGYGFKISGTFSNPGFSFK